MLMDRQLANLQLPLRAETSSLQRWNRKSRNCKRRSLLYARRTFESQRSKKQPTALLEITSEKCLPCSARQSSKALCTWRTPTPRAKKTMSMMNPYLKSMMTIMKLDHMLELEVHQSSEVAHRISYTHSNRTNRSRYETAEGTPSQTKQHHTSPRRMPQTQVKTIRPNVIDHDNETRKQLEN